MKNFLILVIMGLSCYLPFPIYACDCGCNNGALGIFWGYFDPPSKAHLEIIKQALYSYEITKLVIVINNFPNHNKIKTSLVSAVDRENMIKQAIPPELKTDTFILTQNKSDIWDYASIKQKFSKYARFYAIMGEDSYTEFVEKHGKNYIEKNYDVVLLIPREQKIPKNMLARNVLLLPLPLQYSFISSALIRESLANKNKNIADYLEASVYTYIQQKHLYGY